VCSLSSRWMRGRSSSTVRSPVDDRKRIREKKVAKRPTQTDWLKVVTPVLVMLAWGLGHGGPVVGGNPPNPPRCVEISS